MTPLTVANFTERQLIDVFISLCPSSRAHQQETTWRSAELATAWINKANGASLAGKEQSFQYFLFTYVLWSNNSYSVPYRSKSHPHLLSNVRDLLISRSFSFSFGKNHQMIFIYIQIYLSVGFIFQFGSSILFLFWVLFRTRFDSEFPIEESRRPATPLPQRHHWALPPQFFGFHLTRSV